MLILVDSRQLEPKLEELTKNILYVDGHKDGGGGQANQSSTTVNIED